MAPSQEVTAKPARGGRKRHYRIDRWVDFARGLETVFESEQMTRHAACCSACRDLMTFCVKLTAAASIPAVSNSGQLMRS
jgi:hypothetical protein